MKVHSEAPEYLLVIGGIVEVDVENMDLAAMIELGNGVPRFPSDPLCAWGIEKKNMIERACAQQGKDGAGLFLLVNQPFEIGVMKPCECQQNIHHFFPEAKS